MKIQFTAGTAALLFALSLAIVSSDLGPVAASSQEASGEKNVADEEAQREARARAKEEARQERIDAYQKKKADKERLRAGGEAQAQETAGPETAEQAKQRARQERIDAYLKKKADKNAEKERLRAEREASKQAEAAAAVAEMPTVPPPESARPRPQPERRTFKSKQKPKKAETATETAEIPEPVPAKKRPAAKPRRRRTTATAPASRTSRRPGSRRSGGSIEDVQARIRSGPLGTDATVQQYLDMFDASEGTPAQYATFANFIAQEGLLEDAIVYYNAALRLEPENPLLWLNLGTLHRQTGDHTGAENAYGRTIRLTPNNALAHYNRGVSLGALERYEEAIEEFSVALRLDPSLGDPEKNPQVVNNELLLPVRLRLYQDQAGAVGMPLVDVPESDSSPDEEPERKRRR